MITKFSLYERVGVNEDVIIISDFISDYIFSKGKKDGAYVFEKDQLPETNLPINKLIVFYENITIDDQIEDQKKDKRSFLKRLFKPREEPKVFNLTRALFDISKSKKFKSGNVELVIELRTLKKSVIYHEINHALQFTKLGKSKMREQGLTGFMKQFFDPHYGKNEELSLFLYLLYKSNKTEIGSNVVQFYGQLKGLIKNYLKHIKKSKMSNEDRLKFDENYDKITMEWKRDYFKKTLMNREIYKTSLVMKDYDIKKWFKKTDKETLRLFFTELELVMDVFSKKIDIDEDTIKKHGKTFRKYKFIGSKMKGGEELLDDNQLDRVMIKYEKLIRKGGNELRDKLLKTWFLIEDINI